YWWFSPGDAGRVVGIGVVGQGDQRHLPSAAEFPISRGAETRTHDSCGRPAGVAGIVAATPLAHGSPRAPTRALVAGAPANGRALEGEAVERQGWAEIAGTARSWDPGSRARGKCSRRVSLDLSATQNHGGKRQDSARDVCGRTRRGAICDGRGGGDLTHAAQGSRNAGSCLSRRSGSRESLRHDFAVAPSATGPGKHFARPC